MRDTKFATLDEVRNWLHADVDCRREVIIGLDAHDIPVVSHTLEVSNVLTAIGEDGGRYAGDAWARMRERGLIERLRLYARMRVIERDTPFVTTWRLYLQPASGCCCDTSPIKPCKRLPYVDLTPAARQMEWM